MSTHNEQPLYERLGGNPAIEAVMHDFYARVIADPELAPIFTGVNVSRHERKAGAFVAAATGGSSPWRGRDMAAAHAHLSITGEQFDAVAAYLARTLTELGVPADLAHELLSVVGTLREQIVTVPEMLAANA